MRFKIDLRKEKESAEYAVLPAILFCKPGGEYNPFRGYALALVWWNYILQFNFIWKVK